MPEGLRSQVVKRRKENELWAALQQIEALKVHGAGSAINMLPEVVLPVAQARQLLDDIVVVRTTLEAAVPVVDTLRIIPAVRRAHELGCARVCLVMRPA